ncbi:hypothetical protein BGZ98_009035 [Dissophora globulifera]|nr:hypothetical protein BGZ98_009035 [Dissophora globulifera]
MATTSTLLLTDELRAKTKGLHGKTDRLVQLGLFTDHIRDIAKREPEKLVAYPATNYLGLFFGGQIVRSKIVKSAHFFPSPPNKSLGGEQDSGIAIFTFREPNTTLEPSMASSSSSSSSSSPSSSSTTSSQPRKKMDPNAVKATLKNRLNSIPGIDDTSEKAIADRRAIVEEAKEIFVRNMDIMTGVEGVSRVWTRWIVVGVLYAAIAMAIYQILFTSWTPTS